MDDTSLRALEQRARASRDMGDALRYCSALMKLGSVALQGLVGTGRDSWQNLIFRHALKEVGGGSVGFDSRLPHTWRVVGSGDINYGALRVQLAQECRDDNGLHPFFERDARPLTFKETIQARMDQFDAGSDRSLWNSWLDTSTAIVWEAGGQRFKLVHGSAGLDVQSARRVNPLLTTQPARVSYLPVDFTSAPGAILTVDSSYNRRLTFDEVINHQGWLAALEGDAVLLRRYAQTAFALMGRPEGMGFWTPGAGYPDHLRPLCAGIPDGNYGADGGRGLDGYDGRFVRVCPP